jgi:hypothetical protein
VNRATTGSHPGGLTSAAVTRPQARPVTLSVFRGSGRSQSKHRNVRCPLPPEGSAWTMLAPQPGQVGRSVLPMR